MSLKDDIEADINTFFDLEEFAEAHVVDGNAIVCIMDTYRSNAKSDGAEKGLSTADCVLYAKTADLPKRKPAGQRLSIDGRDYEVDKWDVEEGVTVIELYAVESM